MRKKIREGVGICVGGPLDGQSLAALGTIYHVAKLLEVDLSHVRTGCTVGYYTWSPRSGGLWIWDGAF